MNNRILSDVRTRRPLIHHITNQVVMNFTANGLLAFGASPVMAVDREEAADMAEAADALLLNMGTLTTDQLEAMKIAGQAAQKKGIPIVIDPVGIAATDFRSRSFFELIKDVQPTVIKGNAGELAHLAGIKGKMKGVDAEDTENGREMVRKVAEDFQTVAVLTGKTDWIADGTQVVMNETGHPILTDVTGAGCLLGSIIAACLTAQGTSLEKAHAAVEWYGSAAETAFSHPNVTHTGTFIPHFLDALGKEIGSCNSPGS